MFADLIDRPLAHLPSGSFSANSTWAIGAQISRNLLRATDTLTSAAHAVARGATLRRQLLNVPARLALPQGKATLHLPEHWPWANTWTRLWQQVFTPAAPHPHQPDRPPRLTARPEPRVETLDRPAASPHPKTENGNPSRAEALQDQLPGRATDLGWARSS